MYSGRYLTTTLSSTWLEVHTCNCSFFCPPLLSPFATIPTLTRYMVMDASGGYVAPFFVVLVLVGSFFVLNLILAVRERERDGDGRSDALKHLKTQEGASEARGSAGGCTAIWFTRFAGPNPRGFITFK